MTTTYRFKFEKSGRAKFTGHIDVLQTFQRAIKRADLPIAYSKGFNPHQQIAFAAPLSLGYTTIGDYGDFKLTEELAAEEVMIRLNNALPSGLRVLEIKKLREGVKNTMASVAAADYMAVFLENMSFDEISENIARFMTQEHILVMKKTKKGIKEADIKEDIYTLEPAQVTGKGALKMQIASGSVRNLKPESVAEAFMVFLGKDYNRYKIDFARLEMYMSKEGKFIRLNDGVEA